MNLKIKYFKDVSKDEWDGWIKEVGESSSYHSWSYLNYFSKFPDIVENLSFACFDKNDSIVGICPLGITSNRLENYFEISLGGSLCATPALVIQENRARKKILNDIFKTINDFARQYKVKKINMIGQPLTSSFFSSNSLNRNSFELLRYNFLFSVNNTAVIDLSLPEEALLNNVSKYQKRHIERSKKRGLEVKFFGRDSNSGGLKEYFGKYQEAHYKSAGKMTRPQETWDAMLDNLFNGEASLSVVFFNNNPVSFLYCGEFNSMAFGWSQVNLEEYEKELSPRHLLEWETIMYYKKRGFKYYEIGEIFYGSQLFYIPTLKEKSISVFKERYGGFFLPKIKWTGYFDEKLMKNELKSNLNKFSREAAVFNTPEY